MPDQLGVTTAPSLLSETGEVAAKAKRLLGADELIELLRLMVLSRTADDLAVNLQRQGRVNIHAPVRGQEAATAGSALALDPSRDWVAPQYREFPAYVRQGLPLITFWLARLGVGSLGTMPSGVNLLPIQVAISAQVPQAAGLAWGLQLRGTGGVVVTYFGDGGSSEGDFHEGANIAGVLRAPLILFCQNNGWAITTPRSRQTAAPSIAARAVGYGMPGVVVDGNDALAVFAATKQAVDRAREGGGPTLIEAVTYRQGMHNTADDPTRYMDQAELTTWETRDPITRLSRFMERESIIDADAVERLTAECRDELQTALREAEAIVASADPVDTMFDHIFDELPTRLQEQRKEAERWATNA